MWVLRSFFDSRTQPLNLDHNFWSSEVDSPREIWQSNIQTCHKWNSVAESIVYLKKRFGFFTTNEVLKWMQRNHLEIEFF